MKKCLLLSLPFIFCQFIHTQNFEKRDNPAFAAQHYSSSSTSWGDVDNDGDLDLFVTNGERSEPNEFYLNEGGGRFTAVFNNLTVKTENVSSFGAAWGDYDNDGWLDLYVANCSYQRESGERNYLFKNNGDGTFTKMEDHILVNRFESSTSYACSWADYNNDGWLDLYVVNAYDRKNQLYKNNGDGSFQEITSGIIVERISHDIGGNWSDFDNDGDVDLLVTTASWYQDNALFRNNGDGSFEELTGMITSNRQVQWRGANWADYDNDGWMDVLLVNTHGGENVLFSNNAGESFTEVLPPDFTASDVFSGNASHWGDFDNDGDLDLLTTHYIDQDNEYHENDGTGSFSLTENDWTDAVEGGAWNVSCPDVNMDGYLDIFKGNRYKRGGNGGGFENELFLNEPDDCTDYLLISLRGTISNFYGIGAKVIIYGTNAEGQQSLQKREHSCLSGGGYSTQTGNTLHFGLNGWGPIDSIVVHWPSGITTNYQYLALNEHHILYENEDTETVQPPEFAIVPVYDPQCPDQILSLKTIGNRNKVDWYQGEEFFSKTDSIIVTGQLGHWYIAQDGGVCGGRDSFFLADQQLELNIFPNPANTYANFEVIGARSQMAEVHLFDIAGRLIKRFELDLSDGFAREEIPVMDLPSGTYLLIVRVGCWERNKKLVVISD